MKVCWTCKYFYDKCTECKNKDKWEMWNGTERNIAI